MIEINKGRPRRGPPFFSAAGEEPEAEVKAPEPGAGLGPVPSLGPCQNLSLWGSLFNLIQGRGRPGPRGFSPGANKLDLPGKNTLKF